MLIRSIVIVLIFMVPWMFFVAGLVQARIWESPIRRNGFSQNWKRKMNMKCCRGDEHLGNHFQLSCQSFRVLLSYSRMFRDLSVWHIIFWPDSSSNFLQTADGWWTGNTWVGKSPPPTTKIAVSASIQGSQYKSELFHWHVGGNSLYEQLSKRFIPMDHV